MSGLKGRSTRKRCLTIEEERLVIESCKDDLERQTVLILLDTGMHVSVLCTPAMHQLQVKDGHLEWRRPKTGRDVKIKIKKRIAPFVEDYFNKDRPKDRRFYHSMIRDIGRRVGLDVSPMTFRHTFGVRCFEGGLTINTVQRLMGVRNISVLMRYAELTDRMVDKELERIDW